jgi:hypothetical protein
MSISRCQNGYRVTKKGDHGDIETDCRDSKERFGKVIASVGASDRKQRVDMRIHFLPDQAEPNKWIPTRKGIA